jgi:hypothetical protein
MDYQMQYTSGRQHSGVFKQEFNLKDPYGGGASSEVFPGNFSYISRNAIVILKSS